MKEGLPRILVCAREVADLAEYRRLLLASGYEVEGHLFDTPDPADLTPNHLILILGNNGDKGALQLCGRCRGRLEERFLPILFVTEDHPGTRLACLEEGADTCLLRPHAPGELLSQVNALLRIKDIHDHLAEKATEVSRINRRLQQVHEQLDQELELAQRIQASFLPQHLPKVPGTRFAVHYMPRDRVGGDFYDVFRLDEQHVGFYVADAVGHGVPASLLTIFVKKGVRTKEVFGQQYRLVPPNEVLGQLNCDLIEQELSERPFITMAYVLYNHQDGQLIFSRAGHPYPLYIPRRGELQLWRQEGMLLGVFDAHFPACTHTLSAGDKVLLYSDGIDSAAFGDCEAGTPSLLACAEHHRGLGAEEFIHHLARDLFGASAPPDDLTLLALEVSG